MLQNQPSQVNLQAYAATVENILRSIGLDDPSQARMNAEQGYAWSFERGSATIEIYVSEHEGTGFIQVLSPIVHMPTEGLLPLYRRLLELNLQLTNAAIGIYLDTVYLFVERQLEGLDPNEANALITLVAAYADELDNQLVEEFGGRLYGHT